MAPFIKAAESNRLGAAEKSDPLKERLKKKNEIFFFFSCEGAKNGNSFPEAFARLRAFSEKSFQLFSLSVHTYAVVSFPFLIYFAIGDLLA